MKKKAIMVLALAAAMTMSACGGDNGGTAEEVTAANGSVAQEETTTTKETEKETEETTTEETTAAEPENELFAYYKPLSEEYEKYKDKKVSNWYNFGGRNYYIDDFSPIAEYNNVVYFHNRTDDSNNIYSYNIDTKEYKKILDLNSIEFPNAPSNGVYSINFLDGYFYVSFTTNDYKDYNYYKMDLEGNIIQSASIDDYTTQYIWPSLNDDGSIIYEKYNDASENADAKGYVYSIISPDFKTTTEIKAPEIEVEHGLKEKVGVYSLSADGDGNLYCTDTDEEILYIKKGTDEWVDLGKAGYPFVNIAGKYWLNEKTIIDVENGGEVVVKSPIDWDERYFCVDGNMVLHDGAWYKVQIPSDGSKIDYSQYQPMGRESRDELNIIPVNDTYYLYHDDYGYFLHTYEKGEEEEETVVLFEK